MTVTRQKPVIIRRMSDLKDNHMSLGLFCLKYERWGEILSQEWLDNWKPDLHYVAQRFKRSEYGVQAIKQVRPKYWGLGTGTAYLAE